MKIATFALLFMGPLLLGGCEELENGKNDTAESGDDDDDDDDDNGDVTDKDSFDAAFVDKYCDAWDECDTPGECTQNNNDNSGCNFQQDAADACLSADYTCGLMGPDIPLECFAVCG